MFQYDKTLSKISNYCIMDYVMDFQGELIEIDAPTQDCLEEYFMENANIIDEVLCNIPSRAMPNGYGVPYERLDEVYGMINDKYGSCTIQVFEVEENGIKKHLCDFSLSTILTQIFSRRQEYEQGTVDGAELALDMMRNFLVEGRWHYGLIADDGSVLENCEEWPACMVQNDGSANWVKDGKCLHPIIWFGLDGQLPIECWTLYDRPNIRNTKVYWGCDEKIDQEDWKHFWFSEFWAMDWNVLWEYDESAITWAFAECGMDEPEDEFDKVRSSCLIELAQSDSTDEMLAKVQNYCYIHNMQNKSNA